MEHDLFWNNALLFKVKVNNQMTLKYVTRSRAVGKVYIDGIISDGLWLTTSVGERSPWDECLHVQMYPFN